MCFLYLIIRMHEIDENCTKRGARVKQTQQHDCEFTFILLNLICFYHHFVLNCDTIARCNCYRVSFCSHSMRIIPKEGNCQRQTNSIIRSHFIQISFLAALFSRLHHFSKRISIDDTWISSLHRLISCLVENAKIREKNKEKTVSFAFSFRILPFSILSISTDRLLFTSRQWNACVRFNDCANIRENEWDPCMRVSKHGMCNKNKTDKKALNDSPST